LKGTYIRDEELKLKKFETEANIKLGERELEIQENVKKEEVKQTKIQLVKEMLSQGKSKEEIKDLLN
jgi:DNA-binding transcriptional regulator YhcF (GntR family)